MKIVHYFPWLLAKDTGSIGAARGWCRALAESGARVTALVDLSRRQQPPPEGVECVPVEHLGARRLRIPRGVRHSLREADVFVVHSGWLPENVFACRVAANAAIPFVVTTHGAYQMEVLSRRRIQMKRAWNALLERDHLNRSVGVHIFFSDEAEGLSRLGVRATTIVAPNGVDAPPGVRWDGGSGGYLLWLGRFDPVNKGLDVLLKALRSLPDDDRPSLRLYGPDWHGQRRRVARVVSELGLGPWVSLHDPIHGPEKWDLIARAAGCVYPSRWESFGLAPAEAVSIGVPTVVADYPLGRHLARGGGAIGVSITADSIARGIREVFSRRAVSIGLRGAEIIRNEFSWTTVAEAWMKQVRDSVAQRARGE